MKNVNDIRLSDRGMEIKCSTADSENRIQIHELLPASPVVTGFVCQTLFDSDYTTSRQDKACGEAGRAKRMGCPSFYVELTAFRWVRFSKGLFFGAVADCETLYLMSLVLPPKKGKRFAKPK